MTLNPTADRRQPTVAPLEEAIDHARGHSSAGRVIIEYGDYECPYSRQAFRAIQHVERQLGGNLRFAFRHFPLPRTHPRALAAAAAAEAAALRGRFWDIHELLFCHQRRLEDSDLLRYAAQLGLDVELFDTDRASVAVLHRIRRDIAAEGLEAVEIDVTDPSSVLRARDEALTRVGAGGELAPDAKGGL